MWCYCRRIALCLAFRGILVPAAEGFLLLGPPRPAAPPSKSSLGGVPSSSAAAAPVRRRLALNSSTDNTNSSSEEDALEALERLAHLDEKFGEGCGAGKERERLLQRVENWWQSVDDDEQQQDDLSETDDDGDGDEEEEEDDDDTSTTQYSDSDGGGAFVERHGARDRVAIFGGDPSRRQRTVEKRLRPYASLHQFGTPRDAGYRDQRQIVRRIRNRAFDVVYIWTRFGCHSARRDIRDACKSADTRCVEIESLSRIQQQKATQG